MDNKNNNYEELLVKIYDFHKETQDELSKIAIILAKQEDNLQEHMKRTELSEQRLELVENHVMFMNSAVKVIAAIGGIALFVITILQFLQK